MRASSRRFALGLIGLLFVGVLGWTVSPDAVAAPTTAERSEPVDINTASVQQLMTVPGIGEALAKRIVTFRKQNGPFRRVEDLMRVKGIGEKSLERLRPHVKVGKSK